MPPAKKKQKTQKAAEVTPKDAYFRRLEAVLDREKCQGSVLVMGIKADDSDEEGEDEENQVLTAAQVATLRHIPINKSALPVSACVC